MLVQAYAQDVPRLDSQGVVLNANLDRPMDYQLLDDKIRDIEGFSTFGMDAKDMSLVPSVVIPQKFKLLDLTKYKGLSCSQSHVTLYYKKMASYMGNDDLLIHCFKDSLYGASLDEYMSLERTKIRLWRDLFEAFIKLYKYNLDMAHTRLKLHNQSQKSSKTFKEYAHRWTRWLLKPDRHCLIMN